MFGGSVGARVVVDLLIFLAAILTSCSFGQASPQSNYSITIQADGTQISMEVSPGMTAQMAV